MQILKIEKKTPHYYSYSNFPCENLTTTVLGYRVTTFTLGFYVGNNFFTVKFPTLIVRDKILELIYWFGFTKCITFFKWNQPGKVGNFSTSRITFTRIASKFSKIFRIIHPGTLCGQRNKLHIRTLNNNFSSTSFCDKRIQPEIAEELFSLLHLTKTISTTEMSF